MSLRARRILILLVICITTPAPGTSQRLGAGYTLASSGHPELESPRGLEAFARLPMGARWDFTISFSRMTDNNSKIGRVCRSYVPHIGCFLEPTHTSISLSSLRLGAAWPVPLNDRVAIGLGGGASFNLLGGGSKGESGLVADLLVPKGGQIGGFLATSLTLVPMTAFPVALETGLRLHWIGFSACSGGDPSQYDPFCQGDGIQEIQFGLSFPLR